MAEVVYGVGLGGQWAQGRRKGNIGVWRWEAYGGFGGQSVSSKATKAALPRRQTGAMSIGAFWGEAALEEEIY